MSKGLREDLRNTIKQMKNPQPQEGEKNWLRHSYYSQERGNSQGQGAVIDEMCLKGMTVAEMVGEINRRGLNKNNKSLVSMEKRVHRHFKHLTLPLNDHSSQSRSKYMYDIIGHGLPLIKDFEGRWKFDLKKMEEMLGVYDND